MSFFPHPNTLVQIGEQRRADFHAEADGARLVHLAQVNSERRHQRSGHPVVRAVGVVLALLLAASQRV